MYVPAEAGGKTLYVESEATLMGQTLQKPLRTFVIPLLLLLVVFPVAAGQHHHISLKKKTKNKQETRIHTHTHIKVHSVKRTQWSMASH